MEFKISVPDTGMDALKEVLEAACEGDLDDEGVIRELFFVECGRCGEVDIRKDVKIEIL